MPSWSSAAQTGYKCIRARSGACSHSMVFRYFFLSIKWICPDPGREALLAELRSQLSEGCMDFSAGEDDVFFENAAMCDEDVLNRYLETGCVTDDDIRTLIRRRQLFRVISVPR